jgi:hypothetical protein
MPEDGSSFRPPRLSVSHLPEGSTSEAEVCIGFLHFACSSLKVLFALIIP